MSNRLGIRHAKGDPIMIVRLFAFVLVTVATTDVAVSTKDSLTIGQGSYSSILFTVSSRSPLEGPVPRAIRFETAGEVPPGMVFEPYPCHKPKQQNCPAIARADGIYLDGVPTQSGSFRITVAVHDGQGHAISQQFTVVVNPKNGPNR
jgi:hypothetical protein